VQETLYLIPEEQMKATDDKLFPDYAYCSLSEAWLRPKDAKIQFVALVRMFGTSHPAVLKSAGHDKAAGRRRGEVELDRYRSNRCGEYS